MLCTPREVCLHDGKLQWEPVYGADGYNIHSGRDYLFSVKGGDVVEADITPAMQPPFRVSAYKKIKGVSFHTPKSEDALIIGELAPPKIEIPEMIPCPSTNKQDLFIPGYVLETYPLAFEDDFNQAPGSSVDWNKWRSQMLWGPDIIINNEEQYYTNVQFDGSTKSPDPFSFDGNGNIGISAGQMTPTDDNQQKSFYSGVLSTFSTFAFQYGYVSVRAKMADPEGFWGAIWLLNRWYTPDARATGANGKREPEIDIMEIVKGPGGVFGGGPYSIQNANHAYHYDGGQWKIDGNGFSGRDGNGNYTLPGLSQQCDGTQINNAVGWNATPSLTDYAADFHTFGCLWEEDKIEIYIDGIRRVSVCDPLIVSQVPMYLIINQAVGGNFPGPANADDYAQPQTMLVDCAQIYTSAPVQQSLIRTTSARDMRVPNRMLA